jgi:transglutaminase-like putative cysteine protease
MASHRRTAAAALAVVLTSLSLYPVFTGSLWFWVGCGSVAVAALAGTATRLRRLPVPLAVTLSLLAQLLYLNLLFANARSLYHLLPTPGSLAALGHTAAQGFSESSRYAPPVPDLRGLMLLAAAGIGITALLTDLIAVRLARAALAGLPLLLLLIEPFLLSVSRGFLGTTFAFGASVAGYLTLLSSEARDRIRGWEQREGAERDAPDTRPLAAAGRRIGFASIAVALCVPLVLPGLHVTRLFAGKPGIGGSGGTGGSAAVTFPALNAQVSQALREGQAEPVLTYQSNAPQPDYLQIDTLDQLTSSGWQPYSQAKDLVPVSHGLPSPPGLSGSASTAIVTTNVRVEPGVVNDATGALPVPYPARTVSASGVLRADRSTLMVFDYNVTLANLQYAVTSLSESPTAGQLGAAGPPPPDIARSYLPVPSSYKPLKSEADSIAAGAGSQYQEALALQNWLADNAGFKYTLNAPTVDDAASLTRFLQARKGYCEQFAYAMAVFARLIGIPSRLAVGYTAGTPQGATSGSGTTYYEVTTHDAHEWPELYFQGYGWLRFEPTPPGNGTGQGTAFAPAYQALSSGTTSGGSSPGTAAGGAPTAKATGSAANRQRPGGLAGTGTGAASGAGISPWAVLGLVLAGLAVLAVTAPWYTRALIRRRRWRRGRSSRARDAAWAHAAWLELRDDLVNYGAGYRPSESPRATASRAGERLQLAEPARAALGRIALAEERARYAPAPADGSGLRADSTVVRRAIAAAVPRVTRWRARLLPSSVVGRTLDGLGVAAEWSRRRPWSRRA